MTGYFVRYDTKNALQIIDLEVTGYDTLPKFSGMMITNHTLNQGDEIIINWDGFEKRFCIKNTVQEGIYNRVFIEDMTGFKHNAYLQFNKTFVQGSSITDAVIYLIDEEVDVECEGGNFGMPIVFRRSQSRAEAVYSILFDMCWDLDYIDGIFQMRNIPTSIMYEILVDTWTVNRNTGTIYNMVTVTGNSSNEDYTYTALFDDHIAEYGEMPASNYEALAVSHKDDVKQLADFLLETQCYEYTYEFKVPVQDIRINDVIALKNTSLDEVKEIRVRGITIKNNFMTVVGYERNL